MFISQQILVGILIGFPLMAAILSLTTYPKLREIISLFSAIVCTIYVGYLYYIYLHEKTINLGWIYIDLAALVILFLIQSVYLLSVCYSIYFVRKVWGKSLFFLRRRHYYALINLFALSMSFASICRNVGLMWVGLEITTVVSALLIVLEKRKVNIEAAWRYMIIASAGLGIALFSLILFHAFSGTLDWTKAYMPTKAATIVAVLALIGFGTKIGLFPMHTWLPDAHGTAPPSVSAMLSATLLPVAMLAYYRIFTVAISSGAVKVAYITCVFGVLTAIVAALLTISQKIIKRLFAYSSMDVMGIALTGLGLSAFVPWVMNAVLLLLIIHAFSKSALFFTSGNVMTVLETHKIDETTGLIELDKYTGVSMILSSLAVTGAPPFASFIAEILIMVASLRFPILTALLFTAILISFLSINYHVTKMCFGKHSKSKEFKSFSAKIVPAVSTLISLTISIGVWILLISKW